MTKPASRFAGLKALQAQSEPGEVPGETLPTPRKVGRPPGKRSNPDYRQVTVLLEKGVHTAVRKRLLDERGEVSELVNELLVAWLER